MLLLRVREARWRILAVCTARNECPLFSFLANLEGRLTQDSRRMLRLISRVASHGPPRNTELSHQISDGIWELIQGRIRVLWFYDTNRIIVCSHGFVKKSQKTPKLEVERARMTHKRYLRAKRAQTLRIGRKLS